MRKSLQKRLRSYLPNAGEKLRIAHDLHDGVVQDLAALGYSLDSIIGNPLLDQAIRNQLREIRIESSRITAALRNEVLALLNEKNNFNEIIRERFSNSNIELQMQDAIPYFPHNIATDMNKLIMEIANNCIAHSSATIFSIKWRIIDSDCEIVLADNGKGGASQKSAHLGIPSIAKRALDIGARIEKIDSSHGVTYILLIPCS